MVMCQEVYDAQTALSLGLVSEVVPTEKLVERTEALAHELSAGSPIALRLAKLLMRRGLESTFEASLGDASLAVMIANPSQDAHEGVASYKQRRPPQFPGR